MASDDSGSEEDLVDYDISDEEDGDQHIAATREFLMDSVRKSVPFKNDEKSVSHFVVMRVSPFPWLIARVRWRR